MDDQKDQALDKDDDASRSAAADLVRQKVDSAYAREPDAATEALEAAELASSGQLSRHQQFIYDLATSGKPMRDINAAWHEYYSALTDEQKHKVWQEFNEAHAEASKLLRAVGGEAPQPKIEASHPEAISSVLTKQRRKLAEKALARVPQQHRQPLKSLVFGLSVGAVVIFIFLFTFFNERFIAPFIQPSRTVSNTQVITANAPVSTKPEILIPKINVEVPVVYWVKSTIEKDVQQGLENGVVHFGDTAQPGQKGNVVIVGHSANNIFNKGRYKFAFSLLRKLDNGDTFYLTKDGVRYTYQVYKKKIVSPKDVSVLAPANRPSVATLITCDPPGDNARRLVVVGAQIDPSPKNNRAAQPPSGSDSSFLPGNSPSLWSRIVNWFSN